jgi:hypothetical protein
MNAFETHIEVVLESLQFRDRTRRRATRQIGPRAPNIERIRPANWGKHESDNFFYRCLTQQIIRMHWRKP